MLPAQEPAPKRRWTLDQHALGNLLRVFHPDKEQASYAYEALRERLIRFYEWNHIDSPEDSADETIDRLARRVSAGEEKVLDPAKFAVGIARLLLKERSRRKDRQKESLAVLSEHYRVLACRNHESARREERLAMLEKCLDTIPEENRHLIETYFSFECRNHIQARQKLAEEHGISINALRNRVMRIRKELERRYALLDSERISPAREMFPRKLSQYDER